MNRSAGASYYNHPTSDECLLQRLPPEMSCGGWKRGRPRLAVMNPGCPARSRALIVASMEIILLILFLIFLAYRKLFSQHEGPLLEFVALTLSTVVHLALSLLLVHAARQGRDGLVWAWVGVRVVLVATDLAMVMVEGASGRGFTYATCILAFCFVSVINIAVVRSFAIRHLQPVDLSGSSDKNLKGGRKALPPGRFL
ncbi:uncharacterized protein LOC121858238 [Homarus americanus]|uniref:Uncharacterized protein n=1 Tax=Homarus americanus TaxID=6706 RepID=A0A8J5N8P8_HOMAM|nr:uncharacterized protein LOC121858238 [Homarus americanus]KAG7175197.1 hypothetical protein Hamer_G001217 [Homarus americanus]